jgi:plastocyanin
VKNYLILLVIFASNFCFAQNTVNALLIARNTGEKVLANQDTIRVFGFATSLSVQPTVPGPTITANEGDSVHIDVWNVSQGAPHTIHLHGLDVNQQNDGVPHLSFDIGHMEHGYYHFKAPHAGTYLYHCHVASTIHVQAGMYGLIIIKPSNGGNTTWNGGYDFDREKSFLLSEIDTSWHQDSVLLHPHDTTPGIHQVVIPDYHPQFFLVNGFSDVQLISQNQNVSSASNEVNYLRFANIGFYGTRIIFPANLNTKIIDSDGRPLNTAEISDTLTIYPGERYGVLAQSLVNFQDFIKCEYFDLNTGNTANTQLIPILISGFAQIEEVENLISKINVAPNPFKDKVGVNFKSKENTTISIEIFDLNGRIISESILFECLEGPNYIEFGDRILEKGHYFIEFNSPRYGVIVKKVIKI